MTIYIAKGQQKWCCSAIYGSPTPVVRENLWNHHSHLRTMIKDPWLLIGDFNEVLLPSEVRGSQYYGNRAMKFAQVLEQCDLIDLGAKGHQFTWYRKAEGVHSVSKQLDRALGDCDWRTKFPDAFIENLFRHHSNHSPLLLRCNSDIPDKKSRPFRFQAAWLSHKDFPSLVNSAWRKGELKVPNSLHCVKTDVLEFNSKTFGKIFKIKRIVEARIRGIQ